MVTCPPPVEGRLYARSLNDNYYVWSKGAMHLIPDWQTFNTLGYTPNEINVVPDACMQQYPIGAPLPSLSGGTGTPYFDYSQLFGEPAPASAGGNKQAAPTPSPFAGITQAVQAHPMLSLAAGAGAVWFLFGGQRRRR